LEKSWELNGEGDFRLDNGMMGVMKFISRGLDIKTDFAVKSIDYSGKKVEISNTKGETIQADRVVVSVSLGVLKSGTIEFKPALPAAKVEAIKLVQFENAIKVVLKMSKRFWPVELHGVICSDAIIPEFWFDGPERVGALAQLFTQVGQTTQQG